VKCKQAVFVRQSLKKFSARLCILPASVAEIRPYAFDGNVSRLIQFELIPAGIEVIRRGAFTGFQCITEIAFDGGTELTEIGEKAVENIHCSVIG
jgi:hypothetical protein